MIRPATTRPITLLTRALHRDLRSTARSFLVSHPPGVVMPAKSDGPATVRDGLIRGLQSVGQRPCLDPPSWRAGRHLGVLSGVDALVWGIERRRRHTNVRLVAGPNIVVLPTDVEELADWSVPDVVVVPSAWVRELYLEDMPSLADRIAVWSAGVDADYWCPVARGRRDVDVLVYDKARDPDLRDIVESSLAASGLVWRVLEYGSYATAEFRAALRRAATMIFLSPSESQGLALFEAWATDVPTLVWDRRLWADPSGRRSSFASSAPYLSAQTGAAFARPELFSPAFEGFWHSRQDFRPREYILAGHTLAHAARRYMDLFR